MSVPSVATAPSLRLSDVVDAVAGSCAAWVVVERLGAVLAHGVGPSPCPPAVSQSLLSKSTEPLRSAVAWKRSAGGLCGSLDGTAVRVHELGDGAVAWVLGPDVDAADVEALTRAVGCAEPVVDMDVWELLHPRGPVRQGRAPTARLVALVSDRPGLARRLQGWAVGKDARVHEETGVVYVVLPAHGDLSSLRAWLVGQPSGLSAGVADVDVASDDWVVAASLAERASRVAAVQGKALGTLDDAAVAAALVVEEAARAVRVLASRMPASPLRRLVEHDAQPSSLKLLPTVRAWCAAGLDVSTAAAGLHLHPNTLRYRLRRAGEVSGLDIDRADELLALRLLVAEPGDG